MKIAIAKGRGFAECAELIEARGFPLPSDFLSGRLTITDIPEGQVMAVRSSDLPWLLESGHIDVAVGSSIWFDEYCRGGMVEASAIDIARCRLSLIARTPRPVRRICTRFPFLTRTRISARHAGAEIVFMAGSHEVAVVLGITDAMVDVVETGWTLQRFELTELEVLGQVRHGFWVREHDRAALSLVSRLMASRPCNDDLP